MSKTIHGHTKRPEIGPRNHSPEYRAWSAMKTRCFNPNAKRFRDYGGRGITVCDRWLNGEMGKSGFQCFLDDMGVKPSPDCTVDRRDNDGPYSPQNCKWSTRNEQARNSRRNRIVEINGERLTFGVAVERFGAVKRATASMRVKRGWGDVEAITTPSPARRASSQSF